MAEVKADIIMRCLRANVIRVRAKSSLQAGYITAVLSNFQNTISIAKWGSPYITVRTGETYAIRVHRMQAQDFRRCMALP